MKKIILTLLVASFGLLATAQEIKPGGEVASNSLSRSNLAPGQSFTSGDPLVPASITQSTDPATIVAGSVSCNNGSGHADNSYIRRYDLDGEFGIDGEFAVSEVRYGVESTSGPAQPVIVNIYSIPNGAALTFANMTLVGSATGSLAAGSLFFVDQAVTGTVNGATDDLVCEIFTANGQGTGNFFFVGSNALGQTAPSFLAAADCGINEPTDTAAIGFPGMQIIQVITGDVGAGAEVPTLTEWGFIAFITLLMATGVFFTSRRRATV